MNIDFLILGFLHGVRSEYGTHTGSRNDVGKFTVIYVNGFLYIWIFMTFQLTYILFVGIQLFYTLRILTERLLKQTPLTMTNVSLYTQFSWIH